MDITSPHRRGKMSWLIAMIGASCMTVIPNAILKAAMVKDPPSALLVNIIDWTTPAYLAALLEATPIKAECVGLAMSRARLA